MEKVTLTKLEANDLEQFILDNQEAFKYGALEEFGKRDEHYEEGEEIISRKTIVSCIENGEAYRIRLDGVIVGGVVLKIDSITNHNQLDLLFIKPASHSKGIGFKAWQEIEKLYPNTIVWETCTPYFEKRNIHFYVNKCGFKIVEFYNSHHVDPNDLDCGDEATDFDGMFVLKKYMKEVKDEYE